MRHGAASGAPTRMDRSSQPVAAASHGCGSDAASDRASPAKAAGRTRQLSATVAPDLWGLNELVLHGHRVSYRAAGSGPCSSGSTASGDRKSTRLNSSHTVISYAVF